MAVAMILDSQNSCFSFLYPKSRAIVLKPYMLWNVNRIRIKTSRTGCLCKLNAQSGFLSFVNRKKLVRILIPKRIIRDTPLIL